MRPEKRSFSIQGHRTSISLEAAFWSALKAAAAEEAASLLPIDYGPYTFANSAPTQSSVGRDTGIQARGYLANKRLEYRAV